MRSLKNYTIGNENPNESAPSQSFKLKSGDVAYKIKADSYAIRKNEQGADNNVRQKKQ